MNYHQLSLGGLPAKAGYKYLRTGDSRVEDRFVPRSRAALLGAGRTGMQRLSGIGDGKVLDWGTGMTVVRELVKVTVRSRAADAREGVESKEAKESKEGWEGEDDKGSDRSRVKVKERAGRFLDQVQQHDAPMGREAKSPPPSGEPQFDECVDDWLVERLCGGRGVDASRNAARARMAVVQRVTRSLDELRPLDASPDNHMRRMECAYATLALVLPHLFVPGKDWPRGDSTLRMLERLLELDSLFAATHTPRYRIDRLLSVVCNIGMIRPMSTRPEHQGDAIDELGTNLQNCLDALRPGRDAAELDALLGCDGDLDEAILALRTCAVAAVMHRHASGGDGKEAVRPGRDVEAAARAVVKLEAELARARTQLRNAMRDAGVVRTLGAMAGMRIDQAWVDAMRRRMPRSDDFGISLDNLQILQRRAIDSPHADRLRAALGAERIARQRELDAELVALRELDPQAGAGISDEKARDHGREFQAAAARLSALRGDIRYLRARESFLAPQEPGAGAEISRSRRDRSESMKVDSLDAAEFAVEREADSHDPDLESKSPAAGAWRADSGDWLCMPGQAVIERLASRGISSESRAAAAAKAMTDTMAVVRPQLGRLKPSRVSVGKDEDKAQRLGDRLARHLLGDDNAKLKDASTPQGIGRMKALARAIRFPVDFDSERSLAVVRKGQDEVVAMADLLMQLDRVECRARLAMQEHAVFGPGHAAIDRLEVQAIREELAAELGEFLDAMSDALTHRGEKLVGRTLLRDAVRLAILANIQSAPINSFRPADNAQGIMQLLRDWEIPVEQLGPEIDFMLAETFGPDELNLWAEALDGDGGGRESKVRGPASQRERADPAPAAPLYQQMRAVQSGQAHDEKAPMVESGAMDSAGPPGEGAVPGDETRAAKARLLDACDRLQSNTRVRFTGGSRVELATGSIGLTSVLGVGGRLACSSVYSLEIGRSSDGYELVVRTGVDLRAVATATANLGALGNVARLKHEAQAALELAGGRSPGFVLRFSPDEAGRATMKAAIDVLVDQPTIEAHDLPEGTIVCTLADWKFGPRASAGWRPGFEIEVPGGGGEGHYPAWMWAARLGIGLGVQYARQSAISTKGGTRRTSREVRKEASASLLQIGRSGKVLGRKVGVGDYGISGDAGEAGRTVSVQARTREKVVTDANGSIMPGTEIAWYVSLAGSSGVARQRRAYELAGVQFRQMMSALRDSDDPDWQRLGDDVGSLIDSIGPDQMFSFVCTLREDVADYSNDLIQQAKSMVDGVTAAESAEQADSSAALLYEEVDEILGNAANYAPACVRILDRYEHFRSETYVDLGIIRTSNVIEKLARAPVAEVRPATREMALQIQDGRRSFA